MTFCISQNINPFPVSENTLCQFVAQLAHEGISHQSIKGYLSAIRHQQISLDHPNPYICKMPKLEQVIKGIKGIQAKQGSTPRTRLPITPMILLKLREFWELNARSFDHIMLWAAACLCFFGFLRCGEITVPSTTSYDPGAHLSFGDIAVDNLTAPQAIQVHIKASKQTPLGRELYIRGSYRHQAMPSSGYHIIYSSKGTNPRSPILFCLWTATDKRLLCKAGERRSPGSRY